MITQSPLIANGSLSLNTSGDLMMSPDIQTQMPVSLAAYNCIYDYTINSQLIPYLSSIPVGGFTPNTIKNIITNSYKSLIKQGIITNLQISVVFITQSVVNININAADAIGNPITLTWDNTQ